MRFFSEPPANLPEKRGQIALIGIAVGLIVIIVLHFALPDWWAHVLLNRCHDCKQQSIPPYPFSVQNAMWIIFAVGLGELLIRWAMAIGQENQLRMSFLPEDNRTVLQASDLPALYRNLRTVSAGSTWFLPRLIDRCILQFQASSSIDQSASLLNTSMEMFIHEVDLHYNMLRYICWVIPSLGFIGTVIGIGNALEYAGKPENTQKTDLLTDVTNLLAISFNGTFLALVMASILVFLQNIVQSREEHALNLAGQYCLDNLINRLYVPK